MIFRKLYLFILLLSSSLSLEALDISGTIYYERVQPKHIGGSSRLDYSNITKERAKEVFVEAIDSIGNQVSSTFTDKRGDYTLQNINSFTNIKIRVSAKMFKSDHWDVKVIDNSNHDSLYVIEGSLIDTGSTNTIRDLTASFKNRSSAPFAILDSIYQAMNKIYDIDTSINFPPLKINWSVENIATGTYYDGEDNIVMQGDQQGDSDEYDGHIVIHEWGHFFENKFSRADNIGGSHGSNDHLDIRVAFGEGFGNALSAIVTDDPVYFDTFASNGWNMNIESASHQTPGWFSEASIQRILYDLYDKHNDGQDQLSLGFKPIYQVLREGQKKTHAFTSIFSFIDELKKANPSVTDKVDEIVASEDIATIENSYGTDRISNVAESTTPLYSELTVNKTLKNICTINEYGIYNKLGNHRYIQFTINKNDTYPIVIKELNGRDSDPDFTLFKTDSFEKISTQDSDSAGEEKTTLALTKGEYLLDIFDSSYQKKSCFNISIGDISQNSDEDVEPEDNYEEIKPENNNTTHSSSVGFSLPKNIFLAIFLLLAILFVPLLFIRKELKV